MKRYRLTKERKNLLKKIGVELRYAGIVAGMILLLGLLNGLVEMM